MRYQNRSLPLPICAAPGAHLPGHPEYCTLSAFAARVRTLAPASEADWGLECALRPTDFAPVATAAAAAASASVAPAPGTGSSVGAGANVNVNVNMSTNTTASSRRGMKAEGAGVNACSSETAGEAEGADKGMK